MEEERFIDRLKRAGGCVWFLFGGFIIAGLFLIIAGSIIYAANRGTTDGSLEIMCIVLGIICEAFFLLPGEAWGRWSWPWWQSRPHRQ